MFRLPSFIFQLIFNVLVFTVVIRAVDIPLTDDWTVTNWNQSKIEIVDFTYNFLKKIAQYIL